MKANLSGLVLATAASVGLALMCSCSEPPPKEVAKPVITDTRPVGDGLRVVGYAILGAAVVVTVGRAIR